MSRPKQSEMGESIIRRIEAVKLRDEGKTYGQIAERLGITAWHANRLVNSKKNDILCECGRIAVSKFKGKDLCDACLNPDSKPEPRLYTGASVFTG